MKVCYWMVRIGFDLDHNFCMYQQHLHQIGKQFNNNSLLTYKIAIRVNRWKK